jgi:hypothetical protein
MVLAVVKRISKFERAKVRARMVRAAADPESRSDSRFIFGSAAVGQRRGRGRLTRAYIYSMRRLLID